MPICIFDLMFNNIFQEGIDYNTVQQNYLLNKIYVHRLFLSVTGTWQYSYGFGPYNTQCLIVNTCMYCSLISWSTDIYIHSYVCINFFYNILLTDQRNVNMQLYLDLMMLLFFPPFYLNYIYNSVWHISATRFECIMRLPLNALLSNGWGPNRQQERGIHTCLVNVRLVLFFEIFILISKTAFYEA